MPFKYNNNLVLEINCDNNPVSSLYYNDTKVWEPLEPFYIENRSDSSSITGGFYSYGSAPTVTLEYSSDKSTWTSYTIGTDLTIPAEGKVYFRAPSGVTNLTYSINWTGYVYCNCSGYYNAGGDITTLLTKEGKVFDLTGYGTWTFGYLFNSINGTTNKIKDLSKLVLTPNTLTTSCYGGFCQGTASLEVAPEECPAEYLASNCYENMFSSTHIVSAPVLPSTHLAGSCYKSMFSSCSYMTTPPELPATVLSYGCYYNMFRGCTALTYGPDLPALDVPGTAYWAMFQSCHFTTPPQISAVSAADFSFTDMFRSSYITSAPILHVSTLSSQKCFSDCFTDCTQMAGKITLYPTTLVPNCYENMFKNCSALEEIEIRASSWGSNSMKNWVNGVAGTGVFRCPSALGDGSTITRGVDACPEGWTVVNF